VDPAGPAAPAHHAGFTSKCSGLGGGRKHKPQRRVEMPTRERERSVSRRESCGTPVSPAKPSQFAACQRFTVCVLQAGHVLTISMELSLSYEPSSHAIGTKDVG